MTGTHFKWPVPRLEAGYVVADAARLGSRRRDQAVILGAAPCAWDDLNNLDMMMSAYKEFDIIAVSGMCSVFLFGVHMAVCIHGGKLERFLEMRAVRGGAPVQHAFGNFAPEEESRLVTPWQLPNGGGSSSLFAAFIALVHGYERIVLCGVPLHGPERMGYHDWEREGDRRVVKGEPAGQYDVYRPGWERAKPYLERRVRSMSGWTSALLGPPSRKWLRGDDR